jgi:GTP-binding protein HflX
MEAMRKTVLAGVCLKDKNNEFESAMNECEALCEACGMQVTARITQKSDSADTRTAFRKGKLDELHETVHATDSDLVVFLNPLSVQSAQRIAELCECEVIDRTALILDIFSHRARSRQAKLQTEMARLQYDLPKALAMADDHERSRGGSVTNRGAGEMRSAVISKKYQARIQDLKKELEKIGKQRSQDERRRAKTMLSRVALVGYTNAGKSSLMNALMTQSGAKGTHVDAEDLLFKTLDTSVRTIEKDRKKFLLYDTVGFVSNLPHMLVEAFRSTLDAARDADLLIEVIDGSDENAPEKTRITEKTLKEIGAGDIPVLRVYSKCDLMENRSEKEGQAVSCVTGEGLNALLDEIMKRLYPNETEMICCLPYDKMAMLETYKQMLQIEILSNEEDGMKIEIRGPRRYTQAFDEYRIIEGEI